MQIVYNQSDPLLSNFHLHKKIYICEKSFLLLWRLLFSDKNLQLAVKI